VKPSFTPLLRWVAGASGQMTSEAQRILRSLLDISWNRTGLETSKVVTGTAGTTDHLSKWNADGDLVDAGNAAAVMTLLGFSGFVQGLVDDASAAALRDSTSSIGVVRIQTFTSSTTYTPHAKMLYCIIECIGGGGGGGGCAGNGTFAQGAAGGGSGGYSRLVASAATIGASQTVTIGAAGNGASAGANNGAAGGDTSVGSICIAKGGGGGGGVNLTVPVAGAGGTISGGVGTIVQAGSPGDVGILNTGTAGNVFGGAGGGGYFGGGGASKGASQSAGSGTGNAATNYGGGGGGGAAGTVTNQAGGAGFAGLVIIIEFCSS
jgi:hypothetical protein